MFDLGWDEMALIAVVALVVLGPKELPNALRTVSSLMKQARKLAGEFQNGVNEIIREADLEDAKKAISTLNKGTISEAIEKHLDADGEIKTALQKPVDEPVNPAILTEEQPALIASSADGVAATADVNPAVAAFAPGGSATRMPEIADNAAPGEATAAAATSHVDWGTPVEGDPKATPVEAAWGGAEPSAADSLATGPEATIKNNTASEKSKIS